MRNTSDERLVEFSFRSELAADIPPAVLIRLAGQSWSDNTRLGVSGFMRLRRRRLDQTIEGPAAAVLPLAARILTDRRHGGIVVRGFGPIAARRFRGWSVQGFDRFAPGVLVSDAAPANVSLLPFAAGLPRPVEEPVVAVARAT